MLDPHHIQTLKFDLAIPTLAKNIGVQNEVVSVFNTQFTAMLNEVFSAYGKDNSIIIESLTLQLDPVPIETFKKSIVQRSRVQLIAHLEKYLANTKLEAKNLLSKPEAAVTNMHPLLYYLFHGVRSWVPTELRSFSKAWDIALKEIPFITQLKTIIWNEEAVTRLAYQLTPSVYIKTIQKMVPKSWSFIQAWQDLLVELTGQNEPLKPNTFTAVNESIGLATLHFLLLKKGAVSFSKEAFLSFQIKQFALARDLTGHNLATELIDLVKRMKSTATQALVHQEIIFYARKAAGIAEVVDSDFELEKTIDTIKTLVLRSNRSETELNSLKKWILDPANRSIIQSAWIEPLIEKVLENVVVVLTPKGARFILEYHKQLLSHQPIDGIASSKDMVKRTIWSFTLDYLLTSFSSFFQAKQYVFFHSKKMADRYGMDHSWFMQTLMSSIQKLSENEVKYHELLRLLKVIAKDTLGSNTNDKKIKYSNEMHSISKVKAILENAKPVSHWESQMIRKWLLEKGNRPIIQKAWIDQYDEAVFNRIIDCLLPKYTLFIEQSTTVMSRLFKLGVSFQGNTLRFKKLIYINLLAYAQDHPNSFNKKAFITFQIKELLRHFDVSYRMLLSQYGAFLSNLSTSQHRPIEFFSVLNEVLNEFEKQHGISHLHALTNRVSFEQLYYYFESDIHHMSTQTPPFLPGSRWHKMLHRSMAHVLLNEGEKWTTFLLSKGRLWRIHKTILKSMNTALLRHIVVFQANYNKLVELQTALNKHTNQVLTLKELVVIFYVVVGFFPGWVSGLEQRSIKNEVFSKKIKAMLLAHNWSLSAVHNWVINIPVERKLQALRQWTNNTPRHILFCLYDNLFQVYNSIVSDKKPIRFMDFEKSFWITFFNTYAINTYISSSGFTDHFFKAWDRQLKIGIHDNEVVRPLLRTSLFVPDTMVPISSKINSAASQSNAVLNDELINSEQPDVNSVVPLEDMTHETVKSLTKWHIENTGLILVHPFLTQLFKYLKYVSTDSQFKNKRMQWRAVYVLHYIATGDSAGVNEADLAMSKILCGMRIQDPIPRDLALEENEKTYADELLTVLISRWEKLGKTSAEGLRNTFLKRPGLLEEKDQAYQLSIETRGTDILLDYMPWAINIVKLPWLEHIIHTSWR